MVQWLGLGAFTAVGPGSMPGWEIKILKDTKHGQKKKKLKCLLKDLASISTKPRQCGNTYILLTPLF